MRKTLLIGGFSGLLECKAELEMVSHAWAAPHLLANPNLMAFQEYVFFKGSLGKNSCEIGQEMSKATTEQLAGNTAEQRLDLYRTKLVSSPAKNKNS